MERPKTITPKVGTGSRSRLGIQTSVGAALFAATGMAHARGFDAVHEARQNRTAPTADITPAPKPSGAGGRAAARRRAQIEAGQIKRENGLVEND